MLTLIPLVVPFICIFIIAVFYAITLNRKVNETLFISSVTIVFLLYICGHFNFRGLLLIGYALVLIFTLYAVYSIRKKHLIAGDTFKNISLKTGFFTFFVFMVIALLINYGRLFYVWDEFTHWGVVV